MLKVECLIIKTVFNTAKGMLKVELLLLKTVFSLDKTNLKQLAFSEVGSFSNSYNQNFIR